jgi:hypothetical protein
MIKMYKVTWEIDLPAESPREAAEKALAIQRNPESIATIFEVRALDSRHDAEPNHCIIDLNQYEDPVS